MWCCMCICAMCVVSCQLPGPEWNVTVTDMLAQSGPCKPSDEEQEAQERLALADREYEQKQG